VFLAFQYPVEIPGVSNINFLRTALNERNKFLEKIYSSKRFFKNGSEKSALLV
jgi:Fe-S cluster assembly ATP-binding protein